MKTLFERMSEAQTLPKDTLSDQIAAGNVGPEVVEAVAVVLGYRLTGRIRLRDGARHWQRGDDVSTGRWGVPDPTADIRLTLDEIERRGFLSAHDTGFDWCLFMVEEGREQRKDRNLTIAAITALLRALGE